MTTNTNSRQERASRSAAAASMGAALLLGCAPEAPSAGAGETAPPSQTVNYHRDVRPILATSCTNCHSPGGLAPFPLGTYAEARAAGGLVTLRIEDGTMPPWGAKWTDECANPVDSSGGRLAWTDHVDLDEDAALTLAAWEEQGFQEGDPADAPPAPEPFAPLPADLELSPKVPFTVGGVADQHRCFVLPLPEAGDTRWLTGVEVVPGLPRAVHAASVYVDEEAKSDALVGPDGGYPCFGPAGIEGLAPIVTWMAGDPPVRAPDGAAFALPAGARLVLQVHYHPGGQSDEEDLTRLRLQLSGAAPTHVIEPLRVGTPAPFEASGNGVLPGPDDLSGPELRVPAGARDHAEAAARAISPEDPAAGARVLGIAGHMHYAGTKITVDVEREEGPSCLVHVPAHRLDWERMYRFDATIESLPALAAGDRVRVRCTFDNSLDNPQLRPQILAGPDGAPADLVWGIQPLTEVCAATLLVVRPIQ